MTRRPPKPNAPNSPAWTAPLEPACPRCGSHDTTPLRNYGRIVRGRYQCHGCRRWFGPENPPDAGGTGEPPKALPPSPWQAPLPPVKR
jgi:hypothetical protein